MSYPKEYKYTRDHEWAKLDGGNVTVGITDHAQSSLGDIVFVELPKVGRELKAGETFGVVESIKAVSDLYSPIAGKITETNDGATGEPSSLNRDPHGAAWLVKITPTDPKALDALMDADAYTAYVQSLK